MKVEMYLAISEFVHDQKLYTNQPIVPEVADRGGVAALPPAARMGVTNRRNIRETIESRGATANPKGISNN